MKGYANPDVDIAERDRLAYIRSQNPEMSEPDAQQYLDALIARHEKKQELLARGFSNQMAERFLDKQGWPRPFGWRTVFYYPDSGRMRTRYLVILGLFSAFVLWMVFGRG